MIEPTIICQQCGASNRGDARFCNSCGQPLPQPKKLFLSYAHEDERMKKKLVTHLATLQRTRGALIWHDRDIKAGDEWKTEINQHLQNADIILLLISADFVASPYCYSVEMRAAMERHKSGTAKVVPIILRSADLSGMPFMALQALPSGAKAVNKWTDQDEAWVDIVKELKKIL